MVKESTRLLNGEQAVPSGLRDLIQDAIDAVKDHCGKWQAIYPCLDCGEAFLGDNGERKRYCEDCGPRHIRESWKRRGRSL